LIAPNSAASEYLATIGGIPAMVLPTGIKIARPHRSWLLYQLRWRFLLDSWEGGEAYRLAIYGIDVRGLPVRNLIRHKREYPTVQEQSWSLQSGRPAGTDPANAATDDDYELRRARTPVPTFLADAIKRHLGKIYTREIVRDAPPAVKAWWLDVDGLGTCVDHWMSVTIAPLIMVLGHLDILIEPPPAPEDEEVRSRADEKRLKLDTVIASHILPENLPWWKLDRKGEYKELVVREVGDGGEVAYRYWDRECWQLYHGDGKPDGFPVLHHYGMVPIIRLFDRRRPRERHIGMPRYEPLAEIQREYYNRDSECVLSDTTHAHPLLQGPEDYVQADGTVPIGPNWLLPMKKNTAGGTATYQGFTIVDFPTGGMDSLRKNKADLIEAADRASLLMKPAGAQGTTGDTVAQSGISKRLDAGEGNDLLAEISSTLCGVEHRIAELAMTIMAGEGADLPRKETVEISYPRKFSLLNIDELLKGIAEYQAALAGSGQTPLIDKAQLCEAIRLLSPGLDDKEYEAMDAELEEYLERKGQEIQEAREAPPVPQAGDLPPGSGEGLDSNMPPEQLMSETESTERERPGNMVGSHTQ
jgi:hypothetical protein